MSRILILVVAIALCLVIARSYDKTPIKIADKKQYLKPIVAASAIAGLVIGKQLIDGPIFDENVSLSGKTIVITGGNTGLGKATAVKMASLGANTVLLCKSKSRGEDAVEEIKKLSGNNKVSNIQLDLSSLESIRKGASELRNHVDNIDVLVNNAGVMAIPTRTVTADNFEAHIGINHLGHFALTGLLLDLLQKKNNDNTSSRIVNVASHAHLFGKLSRDNLMLDKPGSYEPWPAYGNSKQANILFTHELARRLKNVENNGNVIPLCCHPGKFIIAANTEVCCYLAKKSCFDYRFMQNRTWKIHV